MNDRSPVEDVLAIADAGPSGRRIVYCSTSTLNTPYRAGLTSVESGTAIIGASSANYAAVLFIPNGTNKVFIRSKASGKWKEWEELLTNLSSVWALNSKWATEIEQGADLNDLKTPGSYYSPSEITSKTLKNSPVTSYGFTLKVENCTGNDQNYIRQILMARTDIHMRIMSGADNWLEWVEK